MKNITRFVTAVAICLSGWAVVPFVSLPNLAIGWERFAEAYGEIFLDGLETGDTSMWSRTVPLFGKMVFSKADSDEYYQAWFRGDRAILDADPGSTHEILAGWSGTGVPIFGVDARLLDGAVSLRSRVQLDDNSWVTSQWRKVPQPTGLIEIEWRQGREATQDGALFVAVDDRLLLWQVDLDNDLEALMYVGILHYEDYPVLLDMSAVNGELD